MAKDVTNAKEAPPRRVGRKYLMKSRPRAVISTIRKHNNRVSIKKKEDENVYVAKDLHEEDQNDEAEEKGEHGDEQDELVVEEDKVENDEEFEFVDSSLVDDDSVCDEDEEKGEHVDYQDELVVEEDEVEEGSLGHDDGDGDDYFEGDGDDYMDEKVVMNENFEEQEQDEEEHEEDEEFKDVDSSFVDDDSDSDGNWSIDSDDSDDDDSNDDSDEGAAYLPINEESEHEEDLGILPNKVVMELDGTLVNVLNGWYRSKGIIMNGSLMAPYNHWQANYVSEEVLLPITPLFNGSFGTTKSLAVDIMSFLNDFSLTVNQRNKMEKALMMVFVTL